MKGWDLMKNKIESRKSRLYRHSCLLPAHLMSHRVPQAICITPSERDPFQEAKN